LFWLGKQTRESLERRPALLYAVSSKAPAAPLLVPGTWFDGVHIFNAQVNVHSKRCSLVLVVVFLLVNSVTY
jgi:hypothetical protein